MYKIVGADQKEYGPISEDQIRQWIAEGRANGQTLATFEDGPWKTLSTFPEFAASLPAAVPPPLASRDPVGLPSGAPAKVHGLIITGFTCSILGLFCCGPIFATLGLIFSCIGLSRVNRNPQQYSGKGLAWAGIVVAVLGYVEFAVLVLSGALNEVIRNLPKF